MEKTGVITNTEYKRAREVLRGILGTSYFTDIVATWDLNNLIKFLKLRLDEHAQLEIQDMAQQVYFEIAESGAVPEVLEYLRNNGLTFNPL
jgi:thymidylate synthase (FAD)